MTYGIDMLFIDIRTHFLVNFIPIFMQLCQLIESYKHLQLTTFKLYFLLHPVYYPQRRADAILPTRADTTLPTEADTILPSEADTTLPTRADTTLILWRCGHTLFTSSKRSV